MRQIKLFVTASALLAVVSLSAVAEPSHVFDPQRDPEPPDYSGGGLPDVLSNNSARLMKRTHANQPVVLFVYYNADKAFRETRPRLEVMKAPQHGEISFKRAQAVATYPGERKKCSGKLVDGYAAVFTPSPDYIGRDEASVRVVDDKYSEDDFYWISVRPMGTGTARPAQVGQP